MRNWRSRGQPSRLKRRHSWRAPVSGGLRLGEGALGSAALVFVLSACVSYGVITGFGDSAGERVGLGLAAVAAFGPPSPPGFFGPELPSDLTLVEADAPQEKPATMQVVTGHIPRGSTLADALGGQGVAVQTVDRISRTLRPLFDFRRAQPGDFYALIQDESGEILSFEYQRGRRIVYRLERDEQGLRGVRSELPLERRVVRLAGVIERSLFETVHELGEGAGVTEKFADVFIWDIDFSSQTRPGDEFRMVFEKFYDREGFVRYGNILAAQYRSGARQFTALYFEDKDGYADYYTPDGNSVRRTFLRAPVNYTRISSRYSKSRLHPILKVRRPHEGIDYAAPTGTPVWAVADGEVVFKGWEGGFGRLLKVRHNNGYISYYGHLSAYAEGLKVGSRVQQKQVIGRVGRTGLATGPHLDYRLKLGGRFVDPLKVKFPAGRPVTVIAQPRFAEVRDLRLAELLEVSPALVLEAAM
jgi:murein DD-endopeptidase MepM/ murein hydrolase activator NlpD